MSEWRGPEHFGNELRESAEAKAKRIIAEALNAAGLQKKDLDALRKGDVEKVKIALRLRQETTMTLSWIAETLKMGTKTHLSHLLYWHDKKRAT